MALDEQTREIVEAFREYVEDSVAADERYGTAERHDCEDESTLATRFHAGASCWLEVAVRPTVPQIRVAFLTNDPSINTEIEQALEDSGGTLTQSVGLGFTEAGLRWAEPPVEHYGEDEQLFHFATPLDLEDLEDVDLDEIRGKVLRMLAGYLIAFGAVIVGDDTEEDEEEEEE